MGQGQVLGRSWRESADTSLKLRSEGGAEVTSRKRRGKGIPGRGSSNRRELCSGREPVRAGEGEGEAEARVRPGRLEGHSGTDPVAPALSPRRGQALRVWEVVMWPGWHFERCPWLPHGEWMDGDRSQWG